MRRPALAAVSAAAALLLSSVALATSAGAAPSSGLHHRNDHVCSAPVRGFASCDAIRHDTVDAAGNVVAPAAPKRDGRTKPLAVTPAGYGPADLQAAYKLSGVGGAGKTVAIVDAYDDPNAQNDLNTYRSTYGLPACASGCFTKIGQTGSTTSLPRANGGWAQEISLDLDMVSAACPDCNILLVEAKSASFSDLATAVRTAAARPGVVAISNSYGGAESSMSSTITNSYNPAGIAVTASTGDNGYGAQMPATLAGVVAVGGTSLKSDSSVRGWNETVWSGAGSGCSAYVAKPGYQSGTSCGMKAAADVSAVADPNTGVAVYDSYAYQGQSGWMVFGGTSASSPLIASLYAQGPSTTSTVGGAGAFTWGNATGNLFDVTSGSNGTCSTPIWCNATAGWDGPTGLGTPNGTGAF